MTKIEALAKHLGIEADELSANRYLEEDMVNYGREEYLILTDEEADEKCAGYIRESAWAFRPEFLASHMDGIEAGDLKPIQEKCESANPIILKLIDDVEHFIADAIQSYGRGHFISHYDGEEIELEGGFFAYRLN